MNNRVSITIQENLFNKRIEDILSFFHLSHHKINDYIENGKIIDDEGNIITAGKIVEKRIIYLLIDENINFAPTLNGLDVAYEDEHYLIVNKPRGILIHPDGVDQKNTLANMVASYYKEHHIRRKIRFCNRIDVDTEGLVAIAKDELAESYLNYLISTHQVDKKYYAVCHNKFKNKHGFLNFKIGKDRHVNNKMIVYNKGKEAKTEYTVLKNGKISLVDIKLYTGRTHQIRVHFAHINHPLIGDKIYGNDDFLYLGLQSYCFSFISPFNNVKINVIINLSSSLNSLLKD